MLSLDALNRPQREAVTHSAGPLLVLAGAGSGKTRVLTWRIARLLAEGEEPGSILAITFTNRAANEMKERVRAVVGSGLSSGMWISTFHSACVRLLRAELGRVGGNGSFTIYDSDDQHLLVRRCLQRAQLAERQYAPGAVLGIISQAKSRLEGPDEFGARPGGFQHQRLYELYRLYQEGLRENHALDFDDLILETVRLLRDHEDIRRYYQGRFRHVLVDEYQDTNYAQYELIKLWAGQHRSVFVVGDDDQSIYRFRGAEVGNLLNFEADYPDAKVIKLEENYRSTQNILDAAHHVVSQNLYRREKRLWTRRSAGDPVLVFAVEDSGEEAELVVRGVEERVASGVQLSQCAVLYRTHAQSRPFEEACVRRGLPYRIVGGVGFYARKEIRDLLAYLRLLVNPHDYLSLRRAAQAPRRGLGETSLARLEEHGRQRGLTVLQALAQAEEVEGLGSRQARAAAALGQLLSELATPDPGTGVRELVQATLEASGLMDEIAREAADPMEAESRLENLEEFLAACGEYEASGEGGSLAGFLEGMALMTDGDRWDDTQERVVMMSLHSAKGLEFDTVFLVGMEEGLLPHQRAFDDSRELEEERRLCYVGMTRAKNRLQLSWARERTLFGRHANSIPSRFLADLPCGPPQPLPLAGRLPAPRPLHAPVAGVTSQWRVGDRVRHRHFGTGTVVAVQGDGEKTQVAVAFPGSGIKQLLVAYAGLEREGG
jgi:DNA helicase-2/ATP-dependent DNA helicase PcrA